MTDIKSQSSEDSYFRQRVNDNRSIPDSIPDSVTGTDQYCAERAEQLANAGQSLYSRLKYPLFGCVGLVGTLFIWKLTGLYLYLLSVYPLLALGYLIVVLLIVGFFCRAVIGYLQNNKVLDVLDELREIAEKMTRSQAINKKSYFLRKLKKLYRHRTHGLSFKQTVASLPDYCDDSEVVFYLENHFLKPIDQKAQMAVARCCRDTAVMVSLSPFAAADIFLSLYRTLRMINEVSRLYGVNPSLSGRIKLANLLLQQMTLTVGADLLADQLVEFTSNKLLGTLSKQAGVGLGVGLFTMRVGFQTMNLCRPVAFRRTNRPQFKQVMTDIFDSLR